MQGACRQAVISGDSSLIKYISGCIWRLPIAGHILHRKTQTSDVCNGYSRWLRNAESYCCRYFHAGIQNRLQHSPPWRTVFFGTDDYALVHLKALNENR